VVTLSHGILNEVYYLAWIKRVRGIWASSSPTERILLGGETPARSETSYVAPAAAAELSSSTDAAGVARMVISTPDSMASLR